MFNKKMCDRRLLHKDSLPFPGGTSVAQKEVKASNVSGAMPFIFLILSLFRKIMANKIKITAMTIVRETFRNCTDISDILEPIFTKFRPQ